MFLKDLLTALAGTVALTTDRVAAPIGVSILFRRFRRRL
jgi:hypothetical protein